MHRNARDSLADPGADNTLLPLRGRIDRFRHADRKIDRLPDIRVVLY